MVAWEDYRNYYDTASDFYAQRVLGNGEIAPGWPADGVPISRSGGFELGPFAMVADGLGGMLVAYRIESGGDRVYTQRLTSAGTVAPGWYPNGVSVCGRCLSTDPVAVSTGGTAMIVVWVDNRAPDAEHLYAQYVGVDYPTAALPSARADAEPGRVRLRWEFATGTPERATVYRRGEGSAWGALGAAHGSAPGVMEYEDATVSAGRYAYRLEYQVGGPDLTTPETWVTVPGGTELALSGFQPNPAAGPVAVALSLASNTPARLTVYDAAGRMVVDKGVIGLGPGRHVVPLGGPQRWAPGLYWLRLTQGDRTLRAKGLVVR